MQMSLVESNCFGADWLALFEPLLATLPPAAALLGALWLLGRVRALWARPR